MMIISVIDSLALNAEAAIGMIAGPDPGQCLHTLAEGLAIVLGVAAKKQISVQATMMLTGCVT